MGNNRGNEGGKSPKTKSELPGKKVFHIRLVEHLSWDAYDIDKKCFFPGEESNKPIANKKLKIKILGGKEFFATTNADGVIELKDQIPTDKYEVTFEPESAKSNNKYHLFYGKSTPVKKKL